MKLIAVPPTAIALCAGSVGLLALWLNAHHQRPGVGGWLLLGLCVLCAAAGGFACSAAPRAIMRRIDVPRTPWRCRCPRSGSSRIAIQFGGTLVLSAIAAFSAVRGVHSLRCSADEALTRR